MTSGGYGYSVGKSLALGFIKEGLVTAGDKVEIFILGQAHTAYLLEKPLFDAAGQRLRS